MKETAVKLHIYFPGYHDENKIYDMIYNMLGENIPFQIYDIEQQEL